MDQKGFRCKIFVKRCATRLLQKPIGSALIGQQKKQHPKQFQFIHCWQVKERSSLRRTSLRSSSGYSHDYLLQL